MMDNLKDCIPDEIWDNCLNKNLASNNILFVKKGEF